MKAAVISKYTIDGDPRRAGSDDIHIERAKQIEGPPKWAVRSMGQCLNRQGEWEWEPMPSSRDDEFLARCRFDSAEEAMRACGVAVVDPVRAALEELVACHFSVIEHPDHEEEARRSHKRMGEAWKQALKALGKWPVQTPDDLGVAVPRGGER